MQVIGALALWLLSSAAVCAALMLSFYLYLKAQSPHDPSVFDSLAWAIVFGAPVMILLSLLLGMPIAAAMFALGTKLLRPSKVAGPSEQTPV